MKKLFFLLCCVLILKPIYTKAQEIPAVTKLVDSICHYYNTSQHHHLYNLLTPEFKEKFPESQVAIFYGNIVLPGYGKVTKTKYLYTKQGSQNYLLTCEKNNLQLVLYPTENNKVAGMQWIPYKEESNEPLKKKTSYLNDNNLKTELDLKVDSAVKDYMSWGPSCGLSIAIYKDGSYYYYNYGETKRDNKVLPRNSSIYEIGSITKTFTGVLLAQAVVDKKISLQDDIRKYLPGKYPQLQFGGKPILVEHLANHTSRIPSVPKDIEKQKEYDELNPYKNYDKKMMFAYLNTLLLDTFPGTKNDYSNMGMALLGIILEKVYDKPYSELITEYITKPNGFNNTKINLGSLDLMAKMTGYNENGKETPYWDLGDFGAAGAINSTSKELLDYYVWNMQEKTEVIRLSHELTTGDVNYGVGLGWHTVKTRKGYKMTWHNGGTFGFASFGAYIKDKSCAIVVLSNTGSKIDPVALTILRYLQQ